MTNTKLLMAEMVKKGYTQRSLSEKTGISVNALNLKINNKGIFNTDEADRICDVLGITDCELKCHIFLYHPSQI